MVKVGFKSSRISCRLQAHRLMHKMQTSRRAIIYLVIIFSFCRININALLQKSSMSYSAFSSQVLDKYTIFINISFIFGEASYKTWIFLWIGYHYCALLSKHLAGFLRRFSGTWVCIAPNLSNSIISVYWKCCINVIQIAEIVMTNSAFRGIISKINHERDVSYYGAKQETAV